MFWMALYMLNINSSVIFKVLAIVCPTTSMAQTMAGLVQVIFFVFSGYLQPWAVIPQGVCYPHALPQRVALWRILALMCTSGIAGLSMSTKISMCAIHSCDQR